MYLHKIIPDEEHLRKYKRQYEKDAYFIHEQIWQLASLSKNQKRDFLYRVEYDAYKNVKSILLLASHPVQSTHEMQIQVSPLYNPQIIEGEVLHFKLRANPVVKRKENGKPKEYGLIIDAKHQLKKKGLVCGEDYSLDEIIHKKGLEWLERKGIQHGFFVENWNVAVGGDDEYLVSAEGKNNFLIRTLDFEGKLTVRNTGLFIKALFGGVGSAKAFGCGLLMVRRA
jgi:CRISPR system Cascade subunit CasE